MEKKTAKQVLHVLGVSHFEQENSQHEGHQVHKVKKPGLFDFPS
jgi:hypothetical protein